MLSEIVVDMSYLLSNMGPTVSWSAVFLLRSWSRPCLLNSGKAWLSGSSHSGRKTAIQFLQGPPSLCSCYTLPIWYRCLIRCLFAGQDYLYWRGYFALNPGSNWRARYLQLLAHVTEHREASVERLGEDWVYAQSHPKARSSRAPSYSGSLLDKCLTPAFILPSSSSSYLNTS